MMKNTGNENLDTVSISLCSGKCTLLIGGNSCHVLGDTLVLLSSGQPPELSDKSDGCIVRTVNVTLDELLEFPSPVDLDIISLAMKHPVIPLDGGKASCLGAYYGLLDIQRREAPSTYRTEIIRSVVYALMLEICDSFRILTERDSDMPRPKQEILADDFFRLLARYCRTEHNVDFYAERLHRTPKYLSSAIRRISGRSVPDWIDSVLTKDIKLMLKTTDKTILEISEELNFSSPSAFIQFFRRNTGTTPLRYRKKG